MAIRPIVVWPDDRLRQESVPVGEINDEVLGLYQDLCDTMFDSHGLGIAALQIGDPSRMFLVEAELAGLAPEDPPMAFINPEILEVSEEIQRSDEGCLSFPGVFIEVERPLRAKVRATNLDGEQFEFEGEGLLARCLLHEYDHLTGQLLVDFVGPLKKKMIKRKMKKVQDERSQEES